MLTWSKVGRVGLERSKAKLGGRGWDNQQSRWSRWFLAAELGHYVLLEGKIFSLCEVIGSFIHSFI